MSNILINILPSVSSEKCWCISHPFSPLLGQKHHSKTISGISIGVVGCVAQEWFMNMPLVNQRVCLFLVNLPRFPHVETNHRMHFFFLMGVCSSYSLCLLFCLTRLGPDCKWESVPVSSGKIILSQNRSLRFISASSKTSHKYVLR